MELQELGIWRLLLDESLPPRVRDALTIADRTASPELSIRARRVAAAGLVEAFHLSFAEAAELVDLAGGVNLEPPPKLWLAA